MNDQAIQVLPQHRNELTAGEVRSRVNLIQEVMKSIMKPDTHYGTIPGCQKPSLYKAGSEVLLTTFQIAVEPEVEDLSTPDEIRYRVKAIGVHQGTGVVVGTGIGECSSSEDKYKWRKAVSTEEFNATPETHRRVKYGKNYNTNQVRTQPADMANTVLKMAKKRAQIDLTLTATAASDIFTQDIEDIPEELRTDLDQGAGGPQQQQRQAQPLPAYTNEKFEHNLPKWRELIASGEKTADHIISNLQKIATLTEAQIQEIRKPIEKPAQEQAVEAPASSEQDQQSQPSEQAPSDQDDWTAAYDAETHAQEKSNDANS